MFVKLLAEGMKKVIGKLVSRHQMAFIQGRQIQDTSLITRDCVNSRLKGETPGIMCKIDIEKAYDHVNWEFLSQHFERNVVWRKVVEMDRILY